MKIFKDYYDLGRGIYQSTHKYFGFNKRNYKRTLMAVSAIAIDLLNAFILFELTQYAGGVDEALKAGFKELVSASFTYLAAEAVLVATALSQKYIIEQVAESLAKDMRYDLTAKWLEHHNHYHIGFDKDKIKNPEQRLTDDIQSYTHNAVDTAHSLISLPIRFTSSIYNLHYLSGTLPAKYLGREIPGYMIYPTIIYSFLSNFIASYLAKPFKMIYNKYLDHYAYYRSQLSFIDQNTDQIAAMSGEEFEKKQVEASNTELNNVFSKYYRMNSLISFWNEYSSKISYVISAIMVWPKFQDEGMNLAGYNMVRQQIDTLRDCINFPSQNLQTIAIIQKQNERINELEGKINHWQDFVSKKGVTKTTSKGHGLSIEGFTVQIPNTDTKEGKEKYTTIVDNAILNLQPGKCYRVAGSSGSGKTTFIKAIVDAWPFCSGRINYPVSDMRNVHYVTQKPLTIRKGHSLMEVIAYPGSEDKVDKLKVIEWMNKLELRKHIASIHDKDKDWQNILSGGERQKIELIRVLARKDKLELLVMDESMSALDAPIRLVIQDALKQDANTHRMTILIIDHSPTNPPFHDAEIFIKDRQLFVEQISKKQSAQHGMVY
jgi:putative ATP-binding cassette transporter